MRFSDTALLWTHERALSREACDELVASIERANPGLATNNPMYRDQDRVIRDDPALATTLLEGLRPSLPPRIGALALERRLNERFRLYRYRAGQRFAPHMDHWYQPSARSITLLTVLVYLNEGFEGGETSFCEQIERVVTPQTGLAAVFQHKIRHAGEPVVRGTKYALRTDVLYMSDEDIELTYEE